jgi:hypothetical protein
MRMDTHHMERRRPCQVFWCSLCRLEIERYRNDKFTFEYQVEWIRAYRANRGYCWLPPSGDSIQKAGGSRFGLPLCVRAAVLLRDRMLIHGLLDHVPPMFGFKTFSEVANNYAGGGRSFKETMHHLENTSRKVGDAYTNPQKRDAA